MLPIQKRVSNRNELFEIIFTIWRGKSWVIKWWVWGKNAKNTKLSMYIRFFKNNNEETIIDTHV